ncbi:DUF1244 domain-containing protein [Glaciecola sp. SC05]|uniref:DUF1244 domain-containing protein n=1 Tax=Glaciecola sp. SC05 TaxID=1987355 RepID=UPI0035291E25
MDKQTQTELEAAAFRRLLNHLDKNKDVQNIDLMIVADFCRNCLSKWYLEEAHTRNIDMTDPEAREHIYKMPYADWKEHHQLPATDEQQAQFELRKQRKNA